MSEQNQLLVPISMLTNGEFAKFCKQFPCILKDLQARIAKNYKICENYHKNNMGAKQWKSQSWA
ncbi:MAG: hypothetical protein AAB680_04705 [Pseudomonadota bacterium]